MHELLKRRERPLTWQEQWSSGQLNRNSYDILHEGLFERTRQALLDGNDELAKELGYLDAGIRSLFMPHLISRNRKYYLEYEIEPVGLTADEYLKRNKVFGKYKDLPELRSFSRLG
jgi:hypothetical protein